MRCRLASVCILGLVVTPFVAAADEAYTIKVKLENEVSHVQIKIEETKELQTKLVDDTGKALVDKAQKDGKLLVYTAKALEASTSKEDKRPLRLTQTYDKAQTTSEDKTTDLPYQGKTVLIEKKDGKYQFRIEKGEELTGAAAALLEEEFNKPGKADSEERLMHALLPQKPVRVGETWKVDIDAVSKDFAQDTKMPIDGAKATGTGKLLRAYKKDGHQFGVLEYQVDLPFKAGQAEQLDVVSGNVSLHVKVDSCIDGALLNDTAKMEMKMNLVGKAPLPDKKEGKVTVNVTATSTQTHTELPK